MKDVHDRQISVGWDMSTQTVAESLSHKLLMPTGIQATRLDKIKPESAGLNTSVNTGTPSSQVTECWELKNKASKKHDSLPKIRTCVRQVRENIFVTGKLAIQATTRVAG
jgi:hypothetical protein